MPEISHDREVALLLDCCAERSEPVLDQIQSVYASVSWPRFVALAEHHGVVPHVYLRVSADFGDSTPELLKAAFVAHTKRCLWFANELVRLSEAFHQRRIAFLAYKGAVLAELLYGDLCRRQYNDLDFLVEAANVPLAVGMLQDTGYRCELELSPRQQRAYLESGYEIAFGNALGKNLLELHWRVLPRFYAIDFNLANLFDRSISVEISGKAMTTFCKEDLLLVSCAHAAKHLWMRLSMLCDIAQLASSPDLDWEDIWQQSSQLGLQRIVAVSFLLAQDYLKTPLPQIVQIDETSAKLAREISGLLIKAQDFDFESLAYFRLMLRLRERISDRRRLAWRLATTPSIGEWQATPLPDAAFPLYRLLRVGRLTRRLFSNI